MEKLQAHQKAALEAAFTQIDKGSRKVFVSMAAGTGKIATGIAIIREFLTREDLNQPKKVLIVVPQSKDLSIWQEVMSPELNEFLNEAPGDMKPDLSSVSIMMRDKLDGGWDHLGLPSSFGLVLFYNLNENWYSGNNRSLGSLLDSFRNAILLSLSSTRENSGYFAFPVYKYPSEIINEKSSLALNFKSVELAGFSLVLLNAAVTASDQKAGAMLATLADSIIRESQGEKTVVFCSNAIVATELSFAINDMLRRGYAGVHVGSLTDGTDFSDAMDFKKDDSPPIILCTDNALLTGIDLPNTKFIVILSMVNSTEELIRMLSIGGRSYEGRSRLQVLDYVGIKAIFDQISAEGQLEGLESVLPQIEEKSQNDNVTEQVYFSRSSVIFRDKREVNAVMDVGDLAQELADIIGIIPPEQGAMIGIFGKWGRGKTFLMEETWKVLDKINKFERVEFHAWKYQDTPATWAYLYECLYEAYLKSPSNMKLPKWVIKTGRTITLNFDRKGFWPILKFIAISIIGVVLGYLFNDYANLQKGVTKEVMSYLSVPLTLSVTIYTLFISWKKEYGAKAKDLFLKYSSRHSYKEHLGLQAEIQKETLKLLKVWIPEKKKMHKKILLTVEDIDRCNELKIIQLIDALRVLLEDPEIADRIVIVAAVDERILKMAVQLKYKALIVEKSIVKDSDGTTELDVLTNEYIDKLFIAGIKLGDLSAVNRDDFLTELTRNDRDQGVLTSFETLIVDNVLPQLPEKNRVIEDDIDEIALENYYLDQSLGQLPMSTTLQEEDLISSTDVQDMVKEDLSSALATKISLKELNVLRITLTAYSGATPRQIRIFYYRYLIAKNLLIRRYSKLKRTNIWQLPENCKTLCSLIICYSKAKGAEVLSVDLNDAMNSSQKGIRAKSIPCVEVNKDDYIEVLKVLDIVIAY